MRSTPLADRPDPLLAQTITTVDNRDHLLTSTVDKTTPSDSLIRYTRESCEVQDKYANLSNIFMRSRESGNG